jgi:hypothetical protein
MTDKKSSDSRRKLLKSIAAGSGAVIAGKSLPENWAKPVVDSVMLPAHAQTSCCDISGQYCADGNYGYFEMDVTAQGGVSILWNPPGPDTPNESAITTVTCPDYSFNVPIGQTTMSGTISCTGQVTGILDGLPYTTNPAVCV